MRGTVPGLASPFPLGEQLPGLYLDDPFTQRLTGAFDEVLAAAVQALDCFPAYLDPALAPEDFLEWLGGWVGATPDETWPLERRRAFVAAAAELFRARGTAAGIAAHVAIFTGGEVEIGEPGAAGWSREAGAAIPAGTSPDLFLRVRVRDPKAIPAARLDALVAAVKPAHVTHRVEIVKA
ncbi:MAG: phage tail protein [Chloroflexi bacterium]|nr:phage tail protein [Chloroflexota bacterium]